MSKNTILIFIIALITCYAAEEDPKNAVVSNYEFVRGTSNNYHFGFESSDGTSRKEQGRNDEDSSLAIDGSVSWIAQDGSKYEMTFKAGKNGFRPIIKRVSGP